MIKAVPHRHILGMRVDGTSYADAEDRTLAWARERLSKYVCIANVHMVMEAFDDPEYRALVNGADLVTPDGVPVVWGLRMLRLRSATRVYGPELMPRLLSAAARDGVAVGLYGGSGEVLQRLIATATARYPDLKVVYAHAPPYRPLSPEEDERVVREINESGARLLFVGLGCPKQERWMAEHVGRIRSVMFGVGAAFDFFSGAKAQAPAWMQRAGLEWLFRLACEPRRLWRRYLRQNPRFIWHFGRQVLAPRASEK